MSASECAICAWKANCNLKFAQQSSDLYCKEFTRDIRLGKPDKNTEKENEK